MKWLTMNKNGAYRLGVRLEEGVLDVEAALADRPADGVPAEPMALLRSGDQGVRALADYIADLRRQGLPDLLAEGDIPWAACVPRPGKIICVGLNYRKHADESNLPYPPVPLLFSKYGNAIASEGDDIRIPEGAAEVDYEVELGIVIGRTAASVSEAEALDYVHGYCTANDVSARDWQMRTSQWMLGKTADGFCPIGPYTVTADEVGDPQNLALRTWVNGELRQNSNTKDMIFSCAEIVSYVSRHMTLEAGDLILTGTPEGVAFGMPAESRVYLQPGDVVSVEIEKLGKLTNRFV
ncbi:fumarylacetoacetate hydrolase family protein [Paenibacillaceae bacterium WGS1546]|uniref:fumarylacetoacetate hydrolase family protein n=1 Tax=Cohnella sp. WGS1546 TaxID=3366810 RepID=UPI00372CF458